MSKISIRFYNDREVRAVWDEENSKWWFSVLDIVGVLNDQDDYQKNRNYWKYLKTKLKSENSEVVSGTNQLKLLAAEFKFKATGFRFAKQKAKGEGGSWNYGITESRRLRQTTRQLVNETTSRAAATCRLVVSWTRSLRSDSEAGS